MIENTKKTYAIFEKLNYKNLHTVLKNLLILSKNFIIDYIVIWFLFLLPNVVAVVFSVVSQQKVIPHGENNYFIWHIVQIFMSVILYALIKTKFSKGYKKSKIEKSIVYIFGAMLVYIAISQNFLENVIFKITTQIFSLPFWGFSSEMEVLPQASNFIGGFIYNEYVWFFVVAGIIAANFLTRYLQGKKMNYKD